ncbi:MAG: hypothetical protein O2955_22290 [Planctomycetota bacterium]|nr:hypothetical protein [Planctomycetota bacterium]MDA1215238.1 hypothetical protein [Planctomycetota bacterium]
MKRSDDHTHDANRITDLSLCGRFVLLLIAIASISQLAGCSWMGRSHAGSWWMPKSCRFASDITQDELIATLNQDAAEIQSWESTNVTMKARGQGAPPFGFPAKVAVERPQRFRLAASNPLGGPEVDIGSNEKLFWFWMKQAPEKHVFFANHVDFQGADAPGRLPLNPDWLMSAFGMQPLDPLSWEMTALDGDRVKLTPLPGTDQSPLERTLIVDLCEGHIVEQLLTDRSGKLMARLKFDEFRRCDNAPVIMPHLLVIESPPTEMTIEMHLARVNVNPSQIPSDRWIMPTVAGSPPMNIADMLNRQRGRNGMAMNPFPPEREEQRSTQKPTRPKTLPVYHMQPASHEETPPWDPSDSSPF